MTHINEIINIGQWERVERYGLVYPEGTREKSVYRSPDGSLRHSLKPSHNYLFKKSRRNFPWQFYIEIIAYRVGQIMGVPVPPAYMAMNTKELPERTLYAALIEWFYDDDREDYFDGGKIIGPHIENFDYKKGRQHNLKTIFEQVETSEHSEEIIRLFSAMLTFDTVIGNTDRHQENWGVVYDFRLTRHGDDAHPFRTPYGWMRVSPAFDNGTSMLYNILEDNFHKFDDQEYRLRCLTKISAKRKPMHHMKWSLEENSPLNFYEFMRRMASEYPFTKSVMLGCLEFSREQVETACQGLLGLVAGVEELTEQRLVFTIDNIMERRNLLLEALE